MAKIKTAVDGVKKEKKPVDFMGFMCGLWIVAIICIMPIFSRDAYANILEDKYGFILVANGVLIASFIIWAIASGGVKKYFQGLKEHGFVNWCKMRFNVLDYFLLAFLIIVIISTLQASPYIYQAFFGNEGRWHGALLLSMYVITYFIFSRNGKRKEGYITAFLSICIFMAWWAFMDYFSIDWIGFKYYISDEYRYIFVSSIGNIDTYNGFMAIPMALSGMLLITSKQSLGKRIFYGITYFIVVGSMITAIADNAYLAMAAFFAFAPLIAFKDYKGIRRYLLLIALTISAMQLVVILNSFVHYPGMEENMLFDVCANFKYFGVVTIITWVVAIAMYVVQLKIRKIPMEALAPKIVKTIWAVILIIGAIAVIIIVILANQSEPIIPPFMEPFRDYLVFSDNWGIFRGYVWKLLLRIYGDQPMHHIIFGTGPETAGIYLYNNHFYDVAETTQGIYDSPHNELLQMLFNIGPLGLIAYVGSLLSPLWLAAKKKVSKWYPFILAIGFAGICHMAECVVNIMVPMDIPVLFALIAISCNLYRDKEA